MLSSILFVCLSVFVISWLFSVIGSLIVFYQAKKNEPEFFEKNMQDSVYQGKLTIFWKLMRQKKYNEFKSRRLAKKAKIINLVGKLCMVFFIGAVLLLFYSWAQK